MPVAAVVPNVKTLTIDEIELRPRKAPGGYVIRGDREVWIRGENWGFWHMEQHGCHGPSFSLYDSEHSAVSVTNAKARSEPVRFWSKRRFKYDTAKDTIPTTPEQMRSRTFLAIEAGILQSPAKLKAATEEDHARRMVQHRVEIDKQERIRAALRWGVKAANKAREADLAEAIRDAYREIFCADMP